MSRSWVLLRTLEQGVVMSRSMGLFIASTVLSLTVGTAGAASAQGTIGATSTMIEASVRAAGMGRASNAVFWGDGPDHWGNPALLGYYHGIRFEYGKTQLVPGLAENVYYTTKRLTLGQWGLGLSLAGRPFEQLGGLHLDYDEKIAFDEQGNEIGRFSSWEEIDTWGVGLSVVKGFESLVGLAVSDFPSLSRFGDFSIGYAEKDVEVVLAPAEFTLDGESNEGKVTTEDRGWVARLTPYDSIEQPGLVPALDEILDPLGGIRLDFSYGRSKQNDNRAWITFIDEDQSDPVVETSRRGWAIRGAVGVPETIRELFVDAGLGFIPSSISPLLSVGRAVDRSEPEWPYEEREIERSGWEVTLANMVSVRWGRIDDPEGEIHDSTVGLGLGFELQDMLAVHFDHASVPQAEGLDRVHRNAFSLLVDPVAVWRFMQRGSKPR